MSQEHNEKLKSHTVTVLLILNGEAETLAHTEVENFDRYRELVRTAVEDAADTEPDPNRPRKRGCRGNPIEVVDVGCGTGALGALLGELRPDWELDGVDISLQMLAVAGTKVRGDGKPVYRDLLDVDVDVTGLLPPDSSEFGFDNIASVLQLNSALLERYLTAAVRVSCTACTQRKLVGTTRSSWRWRKK